MRQSLLATIVPALVLLVGCDRSERLVTYELERSLALAELYPDSRILDLGTEAARRSLISGWSWNESNDSGLTFVWSNGPVSEWGFFVFEPRDLVLALEVLPFEAPDAPPQTLRLRTGSTELAPVELEPGLQRLHVPVPEAALVPGWNVFTAEYGWIRSQLDSQKDRRWRRGQRDLAVAWSAVALHEEPGEPFVAGPAPTAEANLRGDLMTVGPGTLVEYELELAPGSLLLAGVDCEGCEGPALEIHLGHTDDPGLEPIGALTEESTELDLGVTVFETRLLILRSRHHGPIVLTGPRVERPLAPADGD